MKRLLFYIAFIRFYKYFKKDIFISHPLSYLGENTQIGIGTNINGYCFIDSKKQSKVVIGKYCAIAHNLRIRVTNHNYKKLNLQYKLQNRITKVGLSSRKGDIIIGNNVWIGDNVTILPGTTIGDGAVIGAGSIVNTTIPSYSIFAGVPAKFIKNRFSEKSIKKIEKLDFWNWSEIKLKNNKNLFEEDFL